LKRDLYYDVADMRATPDEQRRKTIKERYDDVIKKSQTGAAPSQDSFQMVDIDGTDVAATKLWQDLIDRIGPRPPSSSLGFSREDSCHERGW